MPYAMNDGVRIYYEREGTGSPIVVHHGFTLSILDMREWGFVDALKDEHTVIVMDARGHGASDKPHDPADYTFDKRVADVLAVLDDAGVARAIFFGYSMGGVVGYAAAHYAPDRFHAFIIGGAHPDAQDAVRFRQQAEELRAGGMAGYVERLERGGWAIPPAIRARKFANDAEALAASLIASGERPSFTEALVHLRVPMLVFAGDQDQPAHDEAQRAAAGKARVTFVSLPGYNHVSVTPGAVMPHVRTFLADVDCVEVGVV